MKTSVFVTLSFASVTFAVLQCHYEGTKAFTLDCSMISGKLYNLKSPLDFGDSFDWNEIESIQLNDVGIMNIDQVAFSKAFALKTLDLSLNSIDTLSNNQFDQLKSVRTLNLSNNFIKNIQENAFNGMDNLIELDLSRNSLLIKVSSPLQLQYLTNLRLLYLVKIMYIDLTYLSYGNNLKTLFISESSVSNDERTLYNYQNIEKLSLRKTEFYIPNGFLKKFSSLVFLDLSQMTNPLVISQNDIFSKNIQLKYLYLNNNRLTTLRNNLFSSNTELLLLDVSYNEIKSIDSESFAKNKKMISLNLSHNKIGQLQPNIFDALVDLSYLDISFNYLTSLGNAFYYNTKLSTLILKGNALKELKRNILTNNNLLEKLDLSKNRLETFSIQSVANLNQLLYLNLGNNLLRSLPEDLLRLNSLKYLFISCNRLSFLPDRFFSMSAYKSVILHGNPWQCACIENILSNDDVEISEDNLNDGNGPTCYVGASLYVCTGEPLPDRDLDLWVRAIKAYPNICN